MPLPSVLKDLVWTKEFWSEYFGLTSGEREFWKHEGKVVINMPVGIGYSFDLVFYSPNVNELNLMFNCPSLSESIDIASTGYCSFPPVFRWSELQLISRAVAAYDPSTFTHQDLALVLLARFTPLCVGDPLDTAISTVHMFLSSVGFNPKEIKHVLMTIDHRSAGLRWRFDDVLGGWVLQKYRDYTSGSNLHTHRSTDNKDFPFEAWPQFLSAAEESVSNYSGSLAFITPRSATMGVLPKYDLPEQHDIYLNVPIGVSPRTLFMKADQCLNMVLNRILEDLDSGYSVYSGGSRSTNREEFRLEIKLYGDLERCYRVLRQVLWWQAVPEEAFINDWKFSRASTIYLLKSIPQEPHDDNGQFHIVVGKPGAFHQQPRGQELQVDSCNKLFQSALDEVEASNDGNGWRTLRTADGGEIQVCVSNASASQTHDLNTVNLKQVTPDIAKFIFKILIEGDLVIYPGLMTPNKGEKHPFTVLTSEDELLRILCSGPYSWWLEKGKNQVSS